MTDSNGVQWFCHRCARKNDLTLDADPVMLRVCDGCKVENHTRPLTGAVVVATSQDGNEVEVVVEPEVEEVVPEPEPEPVVEPEPEDPYKGLTKAQLVEMLKEKE